MHAAQVFVTELAARNMMHRPDDCEFIGALGKSGEVLAEANAWQFGLDGAVFTPDALGCIWFRVECLVLGWSA
jgi:hypothetical protein